MTEVLPDKAELLCHCLHFRSVALAAHSRGRAPLLGLAGDLAANAVLVSAALPGAFDFGLNLLESLLFSILLLPPPSVSLLLPLGIFFLVDVGCSALSLDAE